MKRQFDLWDWWMIIMAISILFAFSTRGQTPGSNYGFKEIKVYNMTEEYYEGITPAPGTLYFNSTELLIDHTTMSDMRLRLVRNYDTEAYDNALKQRWFECFNATNITVYAGYDAFDNYSIVIFGEGKCWISPTVGMLKRGKAIVFEYNLY